MVFDIDVDAIGDGMSDQSDLGAVMGELECVLKQIAERAEKQVAVASHRKLRVDVRPVKKAFARLRLQRGGKLHFGNEIGQ